MAVFCRYTNLVILGCAVLTVLVAWRRGRVPTAGLAWWLGSAVAAAGIALFNDLVYGGPLTSGYRPGEITFSLSALGPNLRYLPGAPDRGHPHAAARPGRAGLDHRPLAPAAPCPTASRPPKPAATWPWAALAACGSASGGCTPPTPGPPAPGLSTLQAVRFYVDALGAIALLGAWLLIHLARRATLAAVTSAVLVMALFVLGFLSFTVMRTHPFTDMGNPIPSGHIHICHGHCHQAQAPAPRAK